MSNWTGATGFDFTGPLATGDEVTHRIYVKGDGAPIVILQELPGIGPETLELADRLIAAGFRVYLPHLLGPFGKVTTLRNTARLLCIRREFNMFARGRQSPISAWMRALVAEVSSREGGARVGVVGMCLTGSFALALMAEDAVRAAVASQPALPVFGGGALHMSGAEVALARAGMEAKGCALAMRYADDKLVPDRLWDALKAGFGDTLETVQFPGRDHSLLTLDFHSPAYARMEAYFKARFGV